MTAAIVALCDWLTEVDVRQIAMESTGVFGRPICHLLEDEAHPSIGVPLCICGPCPMRAVPGRKTAVKDSDWVADRLGHGRVQPRFSPAAPIREWRDLTRQRKALV
jgi:hypothetical protein